MPVNTRLRECRRNHGVHASIEVHVQCHLDQIVIDVFHPTSESSPLPHACTPLIIVYKVFWADWEEHPVEGVYVAGTCEQSMVMAMVPTHVYRV